MKTYTAKEIAKKNKIPLSHITAVLQRLSYFNALAPIDFKNNGRTGLYNKSQVDFIIEKIKKIKIEWQKAKIRENTKNG